MDDNAQTDFLDVLTSLQQRYKVFSAFLLQPKRALLDEYLAPLLLRTEEITQKQNYCKALQSSLKFAIRTYVFPTAEEWQQWLEMSINERINKMVDAHKDLLAETDGFIHEGRWIDYTASSRRHTLAEYQAHLMDAFPQHFTVSECDYPVDVQRATLLLTQLDHQQQALKDELAEIKKHKIALKEGYFESQKIVTKKIDRHVALHKEEAGALDVTKEQQKLLAIIDSGNQRRLAEYLVPIAEKRYGDRFKRASRLERRGWCDYLLREKLSTSLGDACRTGNIARVESLLMHDFRVDRHDDSGHLIRRRDIKERNESIGYYPLHRVMEADGDTTKPLLNLLQQQLYFEVDVLGPYGRTPLHSAALFGNTEGADWLLSHGANPNAAETGGFQGNTVLHNAASYGHIEVLGLLLQQLIINPLALNKTGITPLCEALLSPHIDSATFDNVSAMLLKKGCCLSIVDWAVLKDKEDILMGGTTAQTKRILDFLSKQSALLPVMPAFLERLHEQFSQSTTRAKSDNATTSLPKTFDPVTPTQPHSNKNERTVIQPESVVPTSAITISIAASIESNNIMQGQLASLRQIKTISRQGDDSSHCRVIPAIPNGDCGLTAIERCLRLQGQDGLANQMTRAGLISLVEERASWPQFEALIADILKSDGHNNNMKAWKENFEKPGVIWLGEHHFRFLSAALNLTFSFYCVDDKTNELVPELSNECIQAPNNEILQTHLYLAHVSTLPMDMEGATLNHFEGLCLNPNDLQIQKIEDWLGVTDVNSKGKVEKSEQDSPPTNDNTAPLTQNVSLTESGEKLNDSDAGSFLDDEASHLETSNHFLSFSALNLFGDEQKYELRICLSTAKNLLETLSESGNESADVALLESVVNSLRDKDTNIKQFVVSKEGAIEYQEYIVNLISQVQQSQDKSSTKSCNKMTFFPDIDDIPDVTHGTAAETSPLMPHKLLD